MPSTAPKQHLFFILLITVFSGFSLGSILWFSDPDSAGKLTHIFLYASLWLMLLGGCTLLELAVRTRFLEGLYLAHLRNSVRQALFLSVLAISLLALQSQDLLYWWVAAPLVLIFLFLELFLNIKI